MVVPKVQVPMDFGVQYLGSPSHSNLKFCLANGEELLANSMIVSYNSPVIERLTTELFQTTIEVEDFAKEAVQCFLEGSYSGVLKKVSKANFKDVNKMAHAFEVSWMVERSLEYFKSLVENVTEENYEDQLYVFEEAMFMLTTLKKRNFVNVLIKKFSSLISLNQVFVIRYVSDLSTFSTKYLDVIIEMTEKQKYILMEILIRHLEKNKSCIDLNSRYLLQNVSFTSCRATHNSIYQQLFNTLEGIETPSKEDFVLILKLFKQSDETVFSLRKKRKYAKIPNLFHAFETIKEFREFNALINFLVESPLVTNSYIFFDAVYCWLCYIEQDWSPDTFVDSFVGAITKNGWRPLAIEYIEVKKRGGLTAKIIENQKLATNSNYSRIASRTEYSGDEFFLNDHDIKFKFKHKSLTNCNKAGDCGFILHVTAATDELGESFDIQLLVDPDLYPSDIHYHDEIQSFAVMHFALDIGVQAINCPVTWYGKPRRDGAQKYWMWGAQRLCNNLDDISIPSRYRYGWGWLLGSDAKIIPVVYFAS